MVVQIVSDLILNFNKVDVKDVKEKIDRKVLVENVELKRIVLEGNIGMIEKISNIYENN